jgi:reactive intermediate/imine deaminase
MTLEYIGQSTNPTERLARPYSPAVRAGDFIYISGQMPIDENGEVVSGGIEAQTRQVMENIRRVLDKCAASFDDVCKCTCWFDDARDFRGFNKVYGSYFPNGFPARSALESRLLLDVKLEVEVVVFKPLN